METEAMNFNPGGTYPLAGERIGPAWRLLWSRLEPRWQDTAPLLAGVAEETGVAVKTLQNLLAKAERAGHVQRRCTGRVGVQTAQTRAQLTSG